MTLSTVPHDNRRYDASLLERISRRDTGALSELYDRHSDLLFSVILRILKEKEVAEDVLQEVFTYVWSNTDQYGREYGHPGAWLCTVAWNHAVEKLRSMDRRILSQESAHENFQDIFTADLVNNANRRAILSREQEEILIALTSLSNEQKGLIEFAYYRGYTLSELAGHFHIPLGTVKARIHASMSILRQKLRRHFA